MIFEYLNVVVNKSTHPLSLEDWYLVTIKGVSIFHAICSPFVPIFHLEPRGDDAEEILGQISVLLQKISAKKGELLAKMELAHL